MLEALETGIDLGEKQRAINPHDADLLSNLADAYSLTGEDARAIRLIEEALQLDPGNVQIQLVAGTVFEEIGNRAAAIDHVVEAVRLGCPIDYVRDFRDFEDLIEDENFIKSIEELSTPAPDSA
jgi:tetratricopeptide (TPR) repeat protein